MTKEMLKLEIFWEGKNISHEMTEETYLEILAILGLIEESPENIKLGNLFC